MTSTVASAAGEALIAIMSKAKPQYVVVVDFKVIDRSSFGHMSHLKLCLSDSEGANRAWISADHLPPSDMYSKFMWRDRALWEAMWGAMQEVAPHNITKMKRVIGRTQKEMAAAGRVAGGGWKVYELVNFKVLAGKPHVTVCWQGFADSHNSDTPVDDILEPLHTYCWANEQAWARCCEWFRDCAELRLQQAGSQAVQAAQGGQARGQGGGRAAACEAPAPAPVPVGSKRSNTETCERQAAGSSGADPAEKKPRVAEAEQVQVVEPGATVFPPEVRRRMAAHVGAACEAHLHHFQRVRKSTLDDGLYQVKYEMSHKGRAGVVEKLIKVNPGSRLHEQLSKPARHHHSGVHIYAVTDPCDPCYNNPYVLRNMSGGHQRGLVAGQKGFEAGDVVVMYEGLQLTEMDHQQYTPKDEFGLDRAHEKYDVPWLPSVSRGGSPVDDDEYIIIRGDPDTVPVTPAIFINSAKFWGVCAQGRSCAKCARYATRRPNVELRYGFRVENGGTRLTPFAWFGALRPIARGQVLLADYGDQQLHTVGSAYVRSLFVKQVQSKFDLVAAKLAERGIDPVNEWGLSLTVDPLDRRRPTTTLKSTNPAAAAATGAEADDSMDGKAAGENPAGDAAGVVVISPGGGSSDGSGRSSGSGTAPDSGGSSGSTLAGDAVLCDGAAGPSSSADGLHTQVVGGEGDSDVVGGGCGLSGLPAAGAGRLSGAVSGLGGGASAGVGWGARESIQNLVAQVKGLRRPAAAVQRQPGAAAAAVKAGPAGGVSGQQEGPQHAGREVPSQREVEEEEEDDSEEEESDESEESEESEEEQEQEAEVVVQAGCGPAGVRQDGGRADGGGGGRSGEEEGGRSEGRDGLCSHGARVGSKGSNGSGGHAPCSGSSDLKHQLAGSGREGTGQGVSPAVKSKPSEHQTADKADHTCRAPGPDLTSQGPAPAAGCQASAGKGLQSQGRAAAGSKGSDGRDGPAVGRKLMNGAELIMAARAARAHVSGSMPPPRLTPGQKQGPAQKPAPAYINPEFEF